MPLDRGTITFRICKLPRSLPEDALELFARDAAGSLDSVRDEPQWGWVSGRHLLERRIDEETSRLGGYLHLCLRQAQRKIPASLLRAEVRMAELALEAETKQHPNRQERKRIKEEAIERLQPQMPPQLSGTHFAVDHNENVLYVTAASENQLDVFLASFRETIGFEPIPLTPDVYAIDYCETDPDALPPVSFSPEIPDQDSLGSVGQAFLTWLWFFQEVHGGELPRSQLGQFSLMVDGPLRFVNEGPGSYESIVRKGAPTASAEARAALLVGKKLKSAKIILAREREEVWEATLDAETFVFRGLKLPEGEALDPGSVFEERINYLYVLNKAFFALYERFLSILADADELTALRKQAKAWVAGMDGK